MTPIADTDPATPLGDVVDLVPGKYEFVVQADGVGLARFKQKIVAGQTVDQAVRSFTNIASETAGAAIDGSSQDRSTVRAVRVSAMLRPADPAQDQDPEQPDDASGARFTALRKFAIETCTESVTSDCSSVLPAGAPGSPYVRIYTSPRDAFDATAPRPLAPDLLFKAFDVPDTSATHVRLVALENQCSGASEYAGEQDDDPANATDCKAASTGDETVRAAELEVFTSNWVR